MAAPLACAVIVAGGAGTRFGNPGGKLLVELAGRPLLSWTIEAFDRAQQVGHIVVVCPDAKRVEYQAQAVEPFNVHTPVSFVTGGVTRQDSTYAGLCAVPAGFELLAVHDGARPLIRPETIDAVVSFVAEHPELAGAICGQSAVDTLKIVSATASSGEPGGASAGTAAAGSASAAGTSATPAIVSTPDRAQYWTVQTPQVFWTHAIKQAFDQAQAAGFGGTDDASVAEYAGKTVVCFESPRDNMKVTVPEDLVPVDAILRARLCERSHNNDH